MSIFSRRRIQNGTEALIRKIRAAELFKNAGKPLEGFEAVQVSSWDEAIDQISSFEWENYCLEHANALTQELSIQEKKAIQKWNEVVREIKPIMLESIESDVRGVQQAHALPKVFSDTVEWDVLNALLEEQYSQYIPKSFYSEMLEWYLQGYFPCGYFGEYPSGRFVVY